MSSISELNRFVIKEFSSQNAQLFFTKKTGEGLWPSEKILFKKYFTKRKARILDIGCGMGRTTIPLHRQSFKIIGIDLVPSMIKNAKKLAKRKKLVIDYRIGDVVKLELRNNLFDYAIFSNQGWTQIPGQKNRLKALKETYRVLKTGGIFIFTVHSRIWSIFWLKQWIKFYFLKPLGFNIIEQDYGDRFFERTTVTSKKTYRTQQYIHIPTLNEVEQEIKKAKFKIIEIYEKNPPTFFICQK